MPRSRPPWGLAVLLAGLAMVSPFSIDTFFPSFRAMSAEFGLTGWQIQQTLTVYLLPYAAMVLVYGPLSDAIGRRPVVIAGMLLYAAGSIACALAPSYAALLVFRAMQGMTAGAGLVIGRTVVRDLYEGPQAQRLMSLITMIFGLAPAVAPVVGGWIHVMLGWRSVFGFLVLLGLALAVACIVRLPETHPPARRRPLDLRGLVGHSLMVLRDREFLLLALAASSSFASLMLFVGAAPAVVLDHWRLAETQFAALFVPIIIGFTAGAWLSGRLAGRIAPRRQVDIAFAVALAGAGLLVALELAGGRRLLLQQITLAMMGAGVQLGFPVLTLRMLDLFPAVRGSVASMQSFVALLVTSTIFGVVAPLLHGSLLTLAVGALLCTLLALSLWRAARRMAHPSGARRRGAPGEVSRQTQE